MSRALLTAAAVVLAFAVARLSVATEPVHVETTPAAAPAATPGARVAYVPVVRAPSPLSPIDDAPTSPEPTASVRDAAPHAAQQANLVVDRALTNGKWSTADRLQLGAMLGQLSEAEANAVLGKLFTSINAGRVTVESMPL